ncbi:MAG: chloride channel protein [Acidimicrobiales bacterium]
MTALGDRVRTAEVGERLRHVDFGQRVLAAAVVLGAATGLAVAAFERIVAGGFLEPLLRAPLGVQLVAPTVGLLLTALVMVRGAPGASRALSDEYLKAFHARDGRLRMRDLPVRLGAGAITLASGCAMGFEAVATHIGATFGSSLQARTSRWFGREQTKVLLVAGAAAGVAAIFKAPATGALFAMEVPFQADLARRTLLPSLLSAATGYLAFVAVNGTAPLFPVGITPPLDASDLIAAVAIGVLAGVGARGFAWMVRQAKVRADDIHPAVRALVGGASIALLIGASRALTGETLALGPGYRTIEWAFEPDHALWVIVGLLVVRGLATIGAVGGGAVGGLFIPLVIEGALLGAAIGHVTGHEGSSLFPVLGIAAFLGAGYRVPLAAVVFVAESTGRPGFVVPGLIAAAASQLPMGAKSVTTYQRARRAGHLEGRLDLPIGTALRTDAATVPSDARLQEVLDHHMLGVRLLSIPVVDGATYRGFVSLADVTAVAADRWTTTTIGEVMQTDLPVADLSWTLGQALAALDEADVDRLAVLDGDAYVGLLTLGEILKLEEVLDAVAGGTSPRHDGTAGTA